MSSYRLPQTYYERRKCTILCQVTTTHHNSSVNAPMHASATCNRRLCQNNAEPVSVLCTLFVVALCVLANPLYDSRGFGVVPKVDPAFSCLLDSKQPHSDD